MSNIKGLFITPHPPIMIPALGEGREREIEKTILGIRAVAEKIREVSPDTLLVITPHGEVSRDHITILDGSRIRGDLRSFGYPHLKMEKINDETTVEKMKKSFDKEGLQGRFTKGEIDHGAFVPLYFIQDVLPDLKIIHISIGMLSLKDLYELGKKIRGILEKASGAFGILASGDLSHRLKEEGPYSYHPKGEVFDRHLINAVKRCNIGDIINMPEDVYGPAGECGLRPIVLGLGIFGEPKMRSEVISYEGPFGVGYMNAWIEEYLV